MFAGGRSHIDDPIRVTDYVQFVLHNKQRVAGCLEPVESHQQRFRIGRMQPRGRFVEHIDHAEQIRTDLRGQAQPLQLARRQRRRASLQ